VPEANAKAKPLGALELSEGARGRLAELRAISEEAEAGEPNARKRLRRLVRSSSPEVIAEASDMAGRTAWMLIKTISAGEPLMQEALQERMHQMRAEIAGENPTPLEVLLTERVVSGWLLVEVLEGLISAQYQRDVKAHRVPPGHIIQQSRILESATRRYLAAVRELARVRKLQASGRRASILPGACTAEEGNVGKGSALNRPQVSGNRILKERPAVKRPLMVELSTGPLAAVGREGVARKGVAQGDHRDRFLPALPQASRRRGMTSCRRPRAGCPGGESRPQNRRPLVSSPSVALYSRNRSIP
jgi:hypothetical protein